MFSKAIKNCQFHSCCDATTHTKSKQMLIEKIQLLEEKVGKDSFSVFEKIALPKNSFLLQEGQVPEYLWFIISGIARVYVPEGKDELTTDFFFANEFVDMYDSSHLNIPSKYSIQLLTEGEAYKISWKQLKQLAKKHPVLSEIEEIIVCCNLHNYKNRILQLQQLSGTERYLYLLKQHPEILKTASLAHIASYLGISQERLSRIRRNLK